MNEQICETNFASNRKEFLYTGRGQKELVRIQREFIWQ